MSKVYDFLQESGYFYVLTINNDFPAGRPFGAVMEYNDHLYIATNTSNNVHKELRNNKHIQILAKKEKTRQWLRINGIANEKTDIDIKQRMLDECPILSKHYTSAIDERYLVFEIEVLSFEFH